MTRKAGLIVGSILIALCVIGCAIGSTFLVWAHEMPAHTDEAHAADLTIQYEKIYINGSPEAKMSIEEQLVSLRTSKWKIHYAGLVMCLAGSTLLITVFRFKLWDIRKLRSATTPRSKFGLLTLASGAWLALAPTLILELEDEYVRDDLTPTIDTGRGVEVLLIPHFVLTGIMLILVGRFIVLRNAALPANLWCWDGDRRNRSIALTIFYGLLCGAIVVLIAISIAGLPWALPSLSVGLYVIASTRAALICGGRKLADVAIPFHNSTTT